MNFDISADKSIGAVPVRLGPFKNSPSPSSVLINGKHPEGATVSHSGDSYWVSCTTTLGARANVHPLIDPGGHLTRALPDLTNPHPPGSPFFQSPVNVCALKSTPKSYLVKTLRNIDGGGGSHNPCPRVMRKYKR